MNRITVPVLIGSEQMDELITGSLVLAGVPGHELRYRKQVSGVWRQIDTLEEISSSEVDKLGSVSLMTSGY